MFFASTRHTALNAPAVSFSGRPYIFSCQRSTQQAVGPWGHSQILPIGDHPIPESHESLRLAIECCRVDVGSTAKRQQSAVTLTALFAKSLGFSRFAGLVQ